MNHKNNIESIKSVNIRSRAIGNRLLMSSSMVAVFESFLKQNIGNEVLVVNTNIGIGIYYYAKNNYSTFIKESIFLYTIKEIDQSELKFRSNVSREEVYQSFCEALLAFSKYPQIFLAYSKKFIYLKEKNSSSKFVIPILNSFFEEVLKVLTKTGKIPHQEKIRRAKNKFQHSNPDNAVIKNLISEVLLKKHYN